MTGIHSLLPNVEDILAVMGDSQITHMTIVREPLSRALTTALNALSLGEFKQTLKEQPFDRYFHLFMLVTTAEGRYVLQKNSVITMNKFEDFPEYSDQIDVELKEGEITMNGILEVTRTDMGDELFFGYDAASNNCQTFIDCGLKSNLMSTSTTETFIVQNSEALFEDNPHFQLIVNDITNLGAVAATKYRLLQDEVKDKAELFKRKADEEREELKRKAEEIKLQAQQAADKIRSIEEKAEDELKRVAEKAKRKAEGKCVHFPAFISRPFAMCMSAK